MPNADAIGRVLEALRNAPLWILIGLALSGYGVLFIPAFGGIALDEFRAKWGAFAWAAAITFSIMSVARGADLIAKAIGRSKPLHLVPRPAESSWTAGQAGVRPISFLWIKLDATNDTEYPVRLASARLIGIGMEKTTQHSVVLVPEKETGIHGSKNAVPPHVPVTVTVHFRVWGVPSDLRMTRRVSLVITDQFDNKYRIRGLKLSSRNI